MRYNGKPICSHDINAAWSKLELTFRRVNAPMTAEEILERCGRCGSGNILDETSFCLGVAAGRGLAVKIVNYEGEVPVVRYALPNDYVAAMAIANSLVKGFGGDRRESFFGNVQSTRKAVHGARTHNSIYGA